MTLIDILRFGLIIGAIAKGIQIGNAFGVLGTLAGAFLGAAGVAFLQVIFVLLGYLFTSSRATNVPPPPLATDDIPTVSQATRSNPREVHPAWFAPIAFGMFTVVGTIGWILTGDVSFLWNCLLLALVTVLLIGLFALALLVLFLIDHVLAMPADIVASRIERMRVSQAGDTN